MKKNITTFICMALCSMTLSAQSVIKHKVKKGETLSSIASKYNIEEWQLLLENPSASSSFRRGMILYIPSDRGNVSESYSNSYSDTYSQEEYESHPTTSVKTATRVSTMDREDAFSPLVHMGFTHQFMGDAKDYYTFNLGMKYEFGVCYHFTDYVLAEALFGYQWSMLMPKSKYDKMVPNTTNHIFTLPIHLGASLPLQEDRVLNVFVGPRFNYLFYSNQKIDGEKIKWSDIKDSEDFKAWNTSLEFGIDLPIGNTALRVAYGIPFVEKKARGKEGTISVGLMF